jgi:cell division protein FtsB
MPRRKVRLKSQHLSFVKEPPVWVRRLVHFALIFGASMLVANALVGENGLVDALDARQRHRVLADDLGRLRLENEGLRQTADRLREDPRAIEEVARGELGLIRPGELLLLFADEPGRSR